jgi:predicted DNA-binding transcriptional regulator YafY
MTKLDGVKGKVSVSLFVSPLAMEHWALQYLNHVEVIKPESLRRRITESLSRGLEKYK